MNQPQKNVSEQELQAFVDDELDSLRRAELEQLIEQDEQLQQRVAEYRAINSGLHDLFDPVLEEAVPERLLKTASPARRSWPLAQAASVVLALSVGLGVGWFSRGELQPLPQTLAMSATDTLVKDAFAYHVVYTPEVRHPVEVGADQEQHLVKWLSKRLKTPLRAPQLDSLGYQLLGGRLLSSDALPAAQFMYQNEQGRRLTLLTRKRDNAESETAFQYASQPGVNGFYWIDRDLSLVLIGDVPRDEVARVAHVVYEDLNR